MSNNYEILLSRKQIERIYALLQETDKARYIWLCSENNLSGIGPDVLVAIVEDFNTDILKKEDITDPSTW